MALGKGLGSILEEVAYSYEEDLNDNSLDESEIEQLVCEIDIDSIDPNPYQPRVRFDEQKLQELSSSIKEHGLIQPVVVVAVENRYILVAGERRLRAHKLAGLNKIKAIVADIDFEEIRMRELALVENIQRENLNPIELAKAYKELIEVHNITHEELARILHKSRSQITNTIRILSLSPEVQKRVLEEKITQGHAKILIGLDESEQIKMADTIIGQKLSVRDTERVVKSKKSSKVREIKRVADENIYKLPKDAHKIVTSALGLKSRSKGNKIEIYFNNNEEWERFIRVVDANNCNN